MSDSTEFSFGGEIVWTPSPEYSDGSHVKRFMDSHGIGDWDELHRRSVEDVAWFTDAMLTYLGIEFATPYSQVVDLSRGNAWPRLVRRWCHEHHPQLPGSLAGHGDRAQAGAALRKRSRPGGDA